MSPEPSSGYDFWRKPPAPPSFWLVNRRFPKALYLIAVPDKGHPRRWSLAIKLSAASTWPELGRVAAWLATQTPRMRSWMDQEGWRIEGSDGVSRRIWDVLVGVDSERAIGGAA